MFIRVDLPDPDAPGQGDQLAPADRQRHALEHRHVLLAEVVGLADVFEGDEFHVGPRLVVWPVPLRRCSAWLPYCFFPPPIFGGERVRSRLRCWRPRCPALADDHRGPRL